MSRYPEFPIRLYDDVPRLYCVWGVFPVLALRSRDEDGHARGPIIYIPPRGDARLLEHELHHSKQWYAYWIALVLSVIAVNWLAAQAQFLFGWAPEDARYLVSVPGILWTVFWAYVWVGSDRLKWLRETAAYGISCQVDGSTQGAGSMAYAMMKHPGYARLRHFGYHTTYDQIRKRFSDGRLFCRYI